MKKRFALLGRMTLIVTGLLVTMAGAVRPASADPHIATWDSREDWESNAQTSDDPTTRVNIDTATNAGSVTIAQPVSLPALDMPRTPAITIATTTKIYTTGVGRNSIAVINRNNNTLQATIPFPAEPSGMVYSTQMNRLYVGHYGQNKVSIVDCATDTVDPTPLTVGNGAYALAYSSDNSKVYISNIDDQTVSIINDQATPTVMPPIAVPTGAFIASHDEGKVYLTDKSNRVVAVIDENNNVTRIDIDPVVVEGLIGGPTPAMGLRAIAPDNITASTRMFASCVYDNVTEARKIQFQIRTATTLAGLGSATYVGPGGSSETWYDCAPTQVDLGIPFAAAIELQLKLSSTDGTSPRLDKLTVTWEQLPDVIVTDVFGYLANVSTGEVSTPLNIKATVKNVGTAATPGDFHTSFHRSSDDIITYSDFRIGTDCSIPTLQPGESYTCEGPPYTIGLNDTPKAEGYTRTYYWGAFADRPDFNNVSESDELNNIMAGYAQVITRTSFPDLVVTSIVPDRTVEPITYRFGEHMLVTVTIVNNGAKSWAGTRPKIALSPDQQIADSEIIFNVYCGSHIYILPGQSATCTADYYVSSSKAGTWYVGVAADEADDLTPTDNRAAYSKQVTFSP